MRANLLPSLDDLICDISAVYTLPKFFDRFEEVINHPKSSLADIAGVISCDQGLTGRILRLANSPLFGCHSRIDTIGKAVTIIGTKQLRDLALATTVIGMFHRIPAELLDLAQFWRHTIGCGLMARTIAIWQREPNPERFFVAGMLHDVGTLVMLEKMPDLALATLKRNQEEHRNLYQTEDATFGYNHAMIGGALLARWQLPDAIVEPVTYHHAPRESRGYCREATIVHLADIMTHAFEIGDSGEHYVPRLDTVAWDQLQLPPTVLRTILNKFDQEYAAVASIMLEGHHR